MTRYAVHATVCFSSDSTMDCTSDLMYCTDLIFLVIDWKLASCVFLHQWEKSSLQFYQTLKCNSVVHTGCLYNMFLCRLWSARPSRAEGSPAWQLLHWQEISWPMALAYEVSSWYSKNKFNTPVLSQDSEDKFSASLVKGSLEWGYWRGLLPWSPWIPPNISLPHRLSFYLVQGQPPCRQPQA